MQGAAVEMLCEGSEWLNFLFARRRCLQPTCTRPMEAGPSLRQCRSPISQVKCCLGLQDPFRVPNNESNSWSTRSTWVILSGAGQAVTQPGGSVPQHASRQSRSQQINKRKIDNWRSRNSELGTRTAVLRRHEDAMTYGLKSM